MSQINIMQARWLDYEEIALWNMAGHVVKILHSEDEAEIQRVTLANLEPLLAEGLLEGLYLHREEGMVPWDLGPQESIAQCKRMWDEVGRSELFPLDAYFVLTEAGREALRKLEQ